MNGENTLLSSSEPILFSHTKEIPRLGEGSAVQLKSGEILYVYSRFTGGGADHDTADLYGGILDLENGEIKNGRIFFQAPDALNQMSVSLERLADGCIGIVWILKTAHNKDDIYFSRSSDEGATWSEPVKVNATINDQYIVVNNDRLRQFSNGRLAIPGAIHIDGDFTKPTDLAILYSDDNGENWAISQRIRILDENVTSPHLLRPEEQQAWQEGQSFPARQQEPGVEELADGQILYYCRTTLGYMYQAFSNDNGETWSELKAATDIVSPCSPQSIRRIPGHNRLLCVFTDRSNIPFGSAEKFWNWRTPLTLAISDDNGTSWQIQGNIEDDSHNYCYTSMLFLDNKLLLTYYESENMQVDGVPQRRNLASLKMRLVDETAYLS